MLKKTLLFLILSLAVTSSAAEEFNPDTFDWDSVTGYPNSEASHGGSYCIDSDGGIDIYEKGTTNQLANDPGPPDENGTVHTNYVANNEHEDYCESGWHVVEGICEADGLWLVYGWDCPDGTYCDDGACVDCQTEDCEERYDPEECNDPEMKAHILSEHCGDGKCKEIDCEDNISCPEDCDLPELKPVQEEKDGEPTNTDSIIKEISGDATQVIQAEAEIADSEPADDEDG